jgi:prephenate dehydratase
MFAMLLPIVEECPGEIRIAVQHEHIFGIAILRCKREIKAACYERWLFCIVVNDDHLVVGRRMIGVREYRQSGLDQVLHRGPERLYLIMNRMQIGVRVPDPDTAGAARHVAEVKDMTLAAVASKLAAEIHGLVILKADVEDADHNVTRFLIMSREPETAKNNGQAVITTFIFRVRNVPAALYKALGGFATNGVNLTKLESYQLEGSFNATQFFADVDGHPEERNVQLALEELKFFTSSLKILGAYPAHPFRRTLKS